MNPDDICNLMAAGVGVLFILVFVGICIQVARDYFKGLSMARSTNEMLRPAGSGVPSLEKMEMSPKKPINKRFPGPYATFSGVYRGRLVYVRWTNVPTGGLRIDIDHLARYGDRMFNLALFTTRTQQNDVPPGQQAAMITPMLRGLCDQVQDIIGKKTKSISTMPITDVSLGVEVQGLMTSDSLKVILDKLSDSCDRIEATLGRLVQQDKMKRTDAHMILNVPDLIQAFIQSDGQPIRVEFMDGGIGIMDMGTKQVRKYDYKDVICMSQGDNEETMTLVFKDRFEISFSAETPISRAGVRAMVLDKLGLLRPDEPNSEPAGPNESPQ